MVGKPWPAILILSDGRGDTAAQVVRAALIQFERQRHRIERHPNIRTAAQVREVITRAADMHAVVFYTLVGDKTRKAILEASDHQLVPIVDVLGPAFTALHDLFKRRRKATPGLLYALERERLDRYEAIDFTLQHDDGRRLQQLDQADVVLVGVSRVAKSSTCFFLAYEGIKAANIPLIADQTPPRELLELDPARVIGLRVNVMRLMTVREVRGGNIGLNESHPYLNREALKHEVLDANRQMRRNGWQSFDASYMAIEEIARRVISLRGLNSPSPD
jgi:regulator of PEP synthase PpsR (kinase-PPPase family)